MWWPEESHPGDTSRSSREWSAPATSGPVKSQLAWRNSHPEGHGHLFGPRDRRGTSGESHPGFTRSEHIFQGQFTQGLAWDEQTLNGLMYMAETTGQCV